MKWSNLKSKKCPKDGTPLQESPTGLECPFIDAYYNEPCKFFITHERRSELVNKLKKPSPRQPHNSKFV